MTVNSSLCRMLMGVKGYDLPIAGARRDAPNGRRHVRSWDLTRTADNGRRRQLTLPATTRNRFTLKPTVATTGFKVEPTGLGIAPRGSPLSRRSGSASAGGRRERRERQLPMVTNRRYQPAVAPMRTGHSTAINSRRSTTESPHPHATAAIAGSRDRALSRS
jgi:hypothetical protein